MYFFYFWENAEEGIQTNCRILKIYKKNIKSNSEPKRIFREVSKAACPRAHKYKIIKQMTSENTNPALVPKLDDAAQNSTQGSPQTPSPAKPAGHSPLLDGLFQFARESLAKSLSGEQVQISDLSQKIEKQEISGESLNEASLRLSLRRTLEAPQDTAEHASADILKSVSEGGGVESVCRAVSAMLRNNCERMRRPEDMLAVVQALSGEVLRLHAQCEDCRGETREREKEIEQLKGRLKALKEKEVDFENMREIEEIKNYNQYMIDLYEKESEKLRLKLKSYKQAVTNQLDNLNIKLGLSPMNQNGAGNDPNGELGQLPFGMEQDSNVASVKDPLSLPFSQPDFFPNPFEQPFSFPGNSQSFQRFPKTETKNLIGKREPNGLMGSAAPLDLPDANGPGRPERGDFYQNYFMSGDMMPLEPPSEMANMLSKREGDAVLPASVQENQSFKKLGSLSKVSSKSKKSRTVRRQDLRYWTLKKAIFCWDGNTNLEIVYKEFVKNLSRLLGDLVSPKEPVIQDLNIKAFTKSSTRQNLLAVKMVLNPRYKSLIEQSWKNGSPSDFFKLKIDLIKKSTILHKESEQDAPREREIKNMKKFPARYNFSQATYNFTSDYVNKDTINRGILAFLKKFRMN